MISYSLPDLKIGEMVEIGSSRFYFPNATFIDYFDTLITSAQRTLYILSSERDLNSGGGYFIHTFEISDHLIQLTSINILE